MIRDHLRWHSQKSKKSFLVCFENVMTKRECSHHIIMGNNSWNHTQSMYDWIGTWSSMRSGWNFRDPKICPKPLPRTMTFGIGFNDPNILDECFGGEWLMILLPPGCWNIGPFWKDGLSFRCMLSHVFQQYNVKNGNHLSQVSGVKIQTKTRSQPPLRLQ